MCSWHLQQMLKVTAARPGVLHSDRALRTCHDQLKGAQEDRHALCVLAGRKTRVLSDLGDRVLSA